MEDKTIGNQQEMFTDAEWGWLAGIIDGEGTISMNVRKKQWKGWDGIGIDLTIAIVNTDAYIIEKAKQLLNKLDIQPYIYETKQNRAWEYPTYKPVLHLHIGKMADMKKVLINLIPHLAGEKKARARIIYDFIIRREQYKGNRTKDGYSWYTAYDWDLVKKFYALSGGKLLPEVKQFLNDHTPNTQLV